MKKAGKIILIIAVVAIIAILAYINIKYNNGWKTFFKISFLEIVNIIFMFIISVLIVNMQSKKEKQKQNFEKILEKFQDNFVNIVEKLYDPKAENRKLNALTSKRKTSNQFEKIKKYSLIFKYKIENEISVIKKELEEYHNFITNDFDIKMNEYEINRITEIIDNACEEIKLLMYK